MPAPGAFVLVEGNLFHGYCVAHPWGGAVPPGLDTLVGSLPEATDCLHIHDLVVTEAWRGRGLVGPMVTRLLTEAAGQGLGWASLVAVAGADRYWSRLGFVLESDQTQLAFVSRSYGPDAVPMRRSTAIAAA